MRWFLLAVPLAVALLIVFRRRTGRPIVQALVLVAIGGIGQAAWPAPFPVDLLIVVASGALLFWLFADYFGIAR